MTAFEKILLQEVSTLPENRHADVLAFIRFLKISLKDDDELDREYTEAIQDARATTKLHNITEQDIENEIRAVREGK